MNDQFSIPKIALRKILTISLMISFIAFYSCETAESNPQGQTSQTTKLTAKSYSPNTTKVVNRTQNKINHPIYTRTSLSKKEN